MPSGKHKSRSLRRVYIKTPRHGTKLRYKIRKPDYPKCANCHAILKGISRGTSNKLKNTNKSAKISSRLYGGFLCSKCSRRRIIQELR